MIIHMCAPEILNSVFCVVNSDKVAHHASCAVFFLMALSNATSDVFVFLYIVDALSGVMHISCCHSNNRPQPGSETLPYSHQKKACGNLGHWSRC